MRFAVSRSTRRSPLLRTTSAQDMRRALVSCPVERTSPIAQRFLGVRRAAFGAFVENPSEGYQTRNPSKRIRPAGAKRAAFHACAQGKATISYCLCRSPNASTTICSATAAPPTSQTKAGAMPNSGRGSAGRSAAPSVATSCPGRRRARRAEAAPRSLESDGTTAASNSWPVRLP